MNDVASLCVIARIAAYAFQVRNVPSLRHRQQRYQRRCQLILRATSSARVVDNMAQEGAGACGRRRRRSGTRTSSQGLWQEMVCVYVWIPSTTLSTNK